MIETMRVDGLCKRNLETLIVDHMHFFLMKGEILGIIGLYDSGRSMLAKILAGIETASEGEICLEGKPVSIQDVRHAHQLGIFCVRAKSTLIPDLTVIENMCLLHTDAGNRFSFPNKNLAERAKALLLSMGIDINPKEKCRVLPLNIQHQIEICRAFFCGAKALILDDITNTYTLEEQEELSAMLLRLQRYGLSMILTGSRAEQMVSVCDRIITMRRGRDAGHFFKDEFSVSVIEKSLTGEEKTVYEPMEAMDWSAPVFSCRDVCSKSLQDFSIAVYPGEVVGFVGRRGRIASDVAGLFNGSNPAVCGSVTIEGKEYTQEKQMNWAMSRCVGYIEHYKNGIFPKLSVQENMTVVSLDNYARGIHISRRLERFAVTEYLGPFGIPESVLEKRMSTQNSLLQMNASLYRWMLKNVKVLVMNDVFSGTDILMRNSTDQFIRQAQKKGIGIIIVSSSEADLRRVCTRIHEIRDGRIVE